MAPLDLVRAKDHPLALRKAMRQAGAAAGGMARAAARAVWTMFGGRHVEEAAEQSGTRTGDHGEPGEAAVGDG